MVDFPALYLKPANMLGSYMEGAQARETIENSRVARTTALEELKAKRDEADKQKKIEQMGEAIAGKDPLMKLMAYNPEMGNTLANYQKGKRDEARQAQMAKLAQASAEQKQQVMDSAKIAATVMQSPAEQRPQAYAQALQLAQQRGIDINGLPPQYAPEVDGMLNQVINAGRGLEDILKREGGFTLGEGQARYDEQGRKMASNVEGGSGVNIKGESELRKEFDGLNKDFRSVKDAYSRVKASAEKPSAAGDLALVFNYMKILDPGSTVREGEFANAQNATGVPGAVVNMYNRALTGERLNDDQRGDFSNRAKMLYEAQAENYNQGVDKYRDLAKQYKFDPDRIVKPIDGIGKETKTIGDKTYVKVKGEWFEQ